MSIRNYEITNLVGQAQKTDVETILQSGNFDLYQFEVCCDINLIHTANFLQMHPEIREHINKLFEGKDTYYLQIRLQQKFKKELDGQAFLAEYNAFMKDTDTRREATPYTYRKRGFDPYAPVNEHLRSHLYTLGSVIIFQHIKEKGLEDAFMQKLKERGIEPIELNEEYKDKSYDKLVDLTAYGKTEKDEKIAKEIRERTKILANCDICCAILYPESKSKEAYFKERFEAAQKLNEWFDFENKLIATEQRVRQSSGEECFKVCMTPISEIEEYVAAQTLKTVFETYYDQASFLSTRANGDGMDLFYTYMHNDSTFGYVPGALDRIGKYRNQPEVEALFESRISDLLNLKTIDGVMPHYADGSPRYFSYYSEYGKSVFQVKMIETVSKDPTSAESQFYFNMGITYFSTSKILAERLIEKYPDFALEILKSVQEHCTATDFAKLYDISQNQALLPMMVDKLKEQQGGTYSLYDKLMACQYALKSGYEAFNEIVEAPLSKEIVIGDNAMLLLKEDNVHQLFYDNLKAGGVQDLCIDLSRPQAEDIKIWQELMQHCHDLEKIKFGKNQRDVIYPEIDASVFLANKKLKELNLEQYQITNAEKLLEGLPCLEVIEKRRDTFKNPEAFWNLLMVQRPNRLEKISCASEQEVEEEKARTLMKTYPDLVIDWNCSTLWPLENRNKAIVKAKKSKEIEDIEKVIREGGLIEYLKLIDPKDRPTLEDFKKRECFYDMRREYGDKYMETLICVADLCGFEEIKKEAEMLKALQDKKLLEHLKAFKPEERPSFASLFEKTVSTEDGKNMIEYIKKAYDREDYPTVMTEILDLTKATDQDLKMLESDSDFALIAKQYADKKKYEQNAEATQAAFEKWKAKQNEK